MIIGNALEIVLRYFVAIACGWIAQHGFKDFDSGDMVSAVTSITVSVVLTGAVLWRALYKSTVSYVIGRLKARHAPALVAAAAQVTSGEGR